MRALLLLALTGAVLTEESPTAPRPPTLSGFLNGSFAMEYSTLPSEEEGRDPWYSELRRNLQRYLMECRRKDKALYRIKDCLVESFLSSLDGFLSEEEIYVNPYLTIVKENVTGVKMDPRKDAEHGDLISAILKRLASVIDTHSFRIRFHDPEEEEVEEFEGRRRHRHYRKAFPMMVAGYMVMSAFLIPLGFQFMAMIGGKALLLAKMAFFMSLFSGYKRLTSDLDYHHHHDAAAHEIFHHGNYFHHRSAEVPIEPFGAHAQHNIFSLRKG